MALSKITNASVADTAVHGRRNLIINGGMQVAQRGTSSTSLAGGYKTVDRFYSSANGYDQLAATFSQSTTSPSGFSNSFKIEVTTAETSLDASELFYFLYATEGQNVQHLEYGSSTAKEVTLSFWVRSSLTGTYSVMFYLGDDGRSSTQAYTINSADTWEYKTITVDGDTTGVIDDDSGAGYNLYFTLSAGANNKGSGTTAWSAYSADHFADSNQVDFTAQTGTFYITGVQLEVGDKATPFEHRSYGEELALCQRYFQKWYHSVGRSSDSQDPIGAGKFNVPMRATPTISRGGGAVAGDETGTVIVAVDGERYYLYNTSGFAAGGNGTASAEL